MEGEGNVGKKEGKLDEILDRFREQLKEHIRERATLAVQEAVDGYFAGVVSIADKNAPGGPVPAAGARRKKRHKGK
jgi:hypothetical protein